MGETIADIAMRMRYGIIPNHRTDHELLTLYADRIEAVAKQEADSIERIVRDAIVDYQDMYGYAPNSDAEQELIERAARANNWLVRHGYEPEKTIWNKEESPCL